VTGGLGFIGGHFIRYWLSAHPKDQIVNLDKVTYAANPESLADVKDNPRYRHVQGDICDPATVDELMSDTDVVVHFAAETHVDRSLDGPEEFVKTNVLGTFNLLRSAQKFGVWRFHHISTDEVYGALPLESENKFDENTQYDPRSPYSASKASSDHFVKAYAYSFKLPVTITNCSNNYGPSQSPEKFIPRMITNLIDNKKIPIYGDGLYVRDWLHVMDHCRAIEAVILRGKPGDTYTVGGLTDDIPNIEVAKTILRLMDKDETQFEYVKDRPGHDRRYAVSWDKIHNELGWSPMYSFEEGMKETVKWYQENQNWWRPLKAEAEAFYAKTKAASYSDATISEPVNDAVIKGDRILIFGNGQIGNFYIDYFRNHGVNAKIAENTDITKIEEVQAAVNEYHPTVIINTAAITNLEWANKNRLETFNVNVLGADNIAEVCDKNNIYFVHFSSGCIFESMDENDAKSETATPSPAAYYSWTKVWSEELVRFKKSPNLKFLVLRPRQPVSAQVSAKNMLIKLLTFTQFIDTPNAGTVIEDLMDWSYTLINQRYTGTLNVANEGWSTPYRIALLLQKHVLPTLPIEKISKARLDELTPNKRVDTILDISKLKTIPGITVTKYEQRLEEIIIKLAENFKTIDKDIVNQALNTTVEASKQRAVVNNVWSSLLRS
ncbi:MAG: dTDP-glucose 4,6-dehydratase, partial [Candidatus Shapirobacteria bacterium]